MLVSELEKNAEIRIKSASAAKSSPSDVSFKSGSRLYNFGDEMVEKNTGGHKPVISRSDIGPVVLIERAVEAVLAPILSQISPARRNQKQ